MVKIRLVFMSRVFKALFSVKTIFCSLFVASAVVGALWWYNVEQVKNFYGKYCEELEQQGYVLTGSGLRIDGGPFVVRACIDEGVISLKREGKKPKEERVEMKISNLLFKKSIFSFRYCSISMERGVVLITNRNFGSDVDSVKMVVNNFAEDVIFDSRLRFFPARDYIESVDVMAYSKEGVAVLTCKDIVARRKKGEYDGKGAFMMHSEIAEVKLKVETKDNGEDIRKYFGPVSLSSDMALAPLSGSCFDVKDAMMSFVQRIRNEMKTQVEKGELTLPSFSEEFRSFLDGVFVMHTAFEVKHKKGDVEVDLDFMTPLAGSGSVTIKEYESIKKHLKKHFPTMAPLLEQGKGSPMMWFLPTGENNQDRTVTFGYEKGEAFVNAMRFPVGDVEKVVREQMKKDLTMTEQIYMDIAEDASLGRFREVYYTHHGLLEIAGAHVGIGVGYFTDGDYKKAIQWYDSGIGYRHPVAFYNMGYMYYAGFGVEKDIEKAREYIREAVKNGLDLGVATPLRGAEGYLDFAKGLLAS
jgi:hypothetical protein